MKKFKKFEFLAAKIQRNLTPFDTVILNDKIRGIKSGIKRQIDITVKKNISDKIYISAIDCKDTSRAVNIKKVEETIGLFEDIPVDQRIIISASGFTDNALTRGTNDGIKMYRLIDTEDHEWKSNPKTPAICIIYKLNNAEVTFDTQANIFSLIGRNEISKIKIYSLDEILLGTYKEFLHKTWLSGAFLKYIEYSNNIYYLKLPVKIKYEELFYEAMMTASLYSKNDMYFQYVPLKNISGFKDETTGIVKTNFCQTADLDINVITSKWQLIENELNIPVKPTFKLNIFI